MAELLKSIQYCDNFDDLELFVNSNCWLEYRGVFQAIAQRYCQLLQNQPEYFEPFGNQEFCQALLGQLVIPDNPVPEELPIPLFVQTGGATNTNSSITNFYGLTLKCSERIKRFGTTGKTYSLEFKDLQSAPNLEETLIGVFDSAIRVSTNFYY